MKLVDDWKRGWTWHSVWGYIILLIASIYGTLTLPGVMNDVELLVSPRTFAVISLGLTLYGLFGRFIKQSPTKSGNP
jgi:hypothetical protein